MTAALPPNQDAAQARVTPTRIAITISLVVAVIATMFAMTTIAQSTQGTPTGAQGTASPGAQDLTELRQTAIDDGVDQLELEFVEYNDSGIEGTATLYDTGDATLIVIAIEDGGEAHPAHIHVGTCDDLTPEPFAALGIVENEVDRLVLIATPFEDLLDGDYSIDLHLAPTELGTLIACADIEGTPMPATPVGTPVGTPAGTPVGTPVGTGTPTRIGGDDRTPTPGVVTATSAQTETATATATATGTPTSSATTTSTVTATATATVEPTATATATASATVSATDAQPAIDVTDTTVDSTSTPPVIEVTATPPNDGTGGIGVIPDGKGEAIAQDGTGGVGGSTEAEMTTTLPRQAGVGSSIVRDSATATVLALGTFSLILAGAAVAVRRADHGGDGPRWGRLGL